jgi:hypothetical protein
MVNADASEDAQMLLIRFGLVTEFKVSDGFGGFS